MPASAEESLRTSVLLSLVVPSGGSLRCLKVAPSCLLFQVGEFVSNPREMLGIGFI